MTPERQAVQDARKELDLAQEEGQRLGDQLTTSRRDAEFAHREMLEAENVDAQPFAVAFRKKQLAEAKVEVLSPRLQRARNRIENAQRTLASRKQHALAAAREVERAAEPKPNRWQAGFE